MASLFCTPEVFLFSISIHFVGYMDYAVSSVFLSSDIVTLDMEWIVIDWKCFILIIKNHTWYYVYGYVINI